MKEFWNSIQLAFAAVGGWLGYFLGGCDGLLIALIIFAVCDYQRLSLYMSIMRPLYLLLSRADLKKLSVLI